MNNRRFVSEELQKKVIEAAKTLNYQADPVARSMKSSRAMTLGIIITSFSRIFFPQVLSGIQTIAHELGYSLIIHGTDDNFVREQQYVELLANTRVDGIILDTVAQPDNTEYFNYLSQLSRGNKKIPVLCMERNLCSLGLHSIYVDNFSGGKLATEHLLKSGSTRIVHISGQSSSQMSIERFKGYREALKEHDIPFRETLALQGDYSPLSGYTAIKRLIVLGIPFDGIVADNDQMAIGAMKSLLENGIRIPQDVRIIGFDNTFVSSIVSPSLTTVNVPKHRLGIQAVQCLVDILKGDNENSPLSKELPIELVERQTTNQSARSDWELEYW